MDYVNPQEVVENMVDAGEKKSKLLPSQLVVRGIFGSVLLGFATTLAFQFELQTNIGMLGAIVFPVGFVMIILLGFELVTGNFALIPLAVLEKKATISEMLVNWLWVLIGHIIGGIIYGVLFYLSITNAGTTFEHPLIKKLIAVSEVKTIGYKELGASGFLVALVKGILCNSMVTLGAVLAMTSKSTIGKIVVMWLPIMTFFGQGFEHSVVNLFAIPTGMLLGAEVTIVDWWVWNQVPVLLGNLIGGLVFTGIGMYFMHKKRAVTVKVQETSKDIVEITP